MHEGTLLGLPFPQEKGLLSHTKGRAPRRVVERAGDDPQSQVGGEG